MRSYYLNKECKIWKVVVGLAASFHLYCWDIGASINMEKLGWPEVTVLVGFGPLRLSFYVLFTPTTDKQATDPVDQ